MRGAKAPRCPRTADQGRAAWTKAARDAILLKSLKAAVDEVRQALGPDVSTWTWGKLHHAQFEHALNPLADDATRAQMTVGRLAMGG